MSDLTDKIKKEIDEMSYERMLRKWRFAPIGDPFFFGSTGQYFKSIMANKKNKLSFDEQVAVSKRVGWCT